MSESQRFLLDLAAIVFFMWLGASLGFTFDNLWKHGESEYKKQESAEIKGEHAANHETDGSIANSSDIGEQSNDHEDDAEQHRLPIRQLNVPIGLNMITLLAAVAGLVGLYMLYGTLEATRTQADTARKEFELSERPWVYIKTLTPTGDGLTYDQRGARFSFNVVLENIGHSPAARTWIYLEPYKFVVGKKIDFIAAQNQVCEPVKKKLSSANGLGYTLFPGQEKPLDWDVFVPLKDITANMIAPQPMVGCVDYEFEFKSGHHQTPIIFTVLKRRAGFPPQQGFALQMFEPVPAKDLVLQEWIEAGANAD
jgi:hypothetical protein